MNTKEIIKSNFLENQEVNALSLENMISDINSMVERLSIMIAQSGKLMACGNGGSSGDAQHIASEFVNRFEMERKEMPAISLNSDTATMTSIANDYGYEYVFSKQVNAIGNDKDVLMAFTTSGNSENILEAIDAAKIKNIDIILFSGGTGGKAKKMMGENDIQIIIPSKRTSRIQEMHLIIIHALCECLEKNLNK